MVKQTKSFLEILHKGFAIWQNIKLGQVKIESWILMSSKNILKFASLDWKQIIIDTTVYWIT